MKIENFPVNFKSTKLNEVKQNKNDERKDIKPQMKELYSSNMSSSIKALNSSSINFRGNEKKGDGILNIRFSDEMSAALRKRTLGIISNKIIDKQYEQLKKGDKNLDLTKKDNVAKIMERNPEYFDFMSTLRQQDKNGKIDTYPCYFMDFDGLEEYYVKDKDFFKKIASSQLINYDNSISPRYTAGSIKALCEIHRDSPELADEIHNQRGGQYGKEDINHQSIRFTKWDIEEFYKAYKTNKNLALDLLFKKDVRKEEDGFRPYLLNADQICLIANSYQENDKEILDKLLSATFENDYLMYAADSDKINYIARMLPVFHNKSEVIERILGETIFDEKSECNLQVFNISDIGRLYHEADKLGYGTKEFEELYNAHKRINTLLLEKTSFGLLDMERISNELFKVDAEILNDSSFLIENFEMKDDTQISSFLSRCLKQKGYAKTFVATYNKLSEEEKQFPERIFEKDQLVLKNNDREIVIDDSGCIDRNYLK